jgi:three-Cys-motif partner protein
LTKNNDKWEWAIGEPPPELDPHSKVKHKLVTDYLHRYVSVLMANERIPKLKLTLVDGFAGGGLYTDGGNIAFGSPLLLLNTIAEAEAILNINRHHTPRKIDAQYHFVELEKSNIEYLRHVLVAEGHAHRIGTDVALYQNDFEKVYRNIVAAAEARRGGHRALFLLDQYAYHDIKLPTVQYIFSRLQGAEVIMTFNVDSLITFLNDSDQFHKITRKIGLEQYIDWQAYATLKAQGGWRQIIQRQLAYGIWKASGAKFMTLFFVTPLGGAPWSYWLVHLSNAYKANDVMKGVHWLHGNSFGHSLEAGLFQIGYQANRDESVTGQAGFEFIQAAAFDDELHRASIDTLREQLPRIIHANSDGITFLNLMEAIANNTNATADIARASLHDHIIAKDLQAFKNGGGIRTKGTSIHDSDIIIPHKQRSFFM